MSAPTRERTMPPRTTPRRTVQVTGHPGPVRRAPRSPRLVEIERRRPRRRTAERLNIGAQPDKLAAWAFMLGLLLVLIALTA